MATETVTVMFTDLVGSTALLTQVGEQAGETLRQEHFALLRGAVEPTGGREVKNLGDGLMVVFASSADAVAAAVELQRTFEHRNRRAEHRLLIRVGISVGDADVEDDDYFGVPVVEAARLCARAAGGEVLVTDVVRVLAGSRGGFTFVPVGEVELKGLDHPVAACRVEWEPSMAADDRPPLPPRLGSQMATHFVGRTMEGDQLEGAWKEAVNEGERRVVLLGGEPGIGKTTLSARLARQVYEDGALVIYGRCDDDLGVPYQPWVEALSQLVEHADEQLLGDHVAERGRHLVRLVPALARRLPAGDDVGETTDGDSETNRFVLFGCVVDLLRRATEDHPVLLVLDDLHWADRPTVQLLRHVVQADVPLRMAVLGTFRDSEVTAGDPMSELLAALHRESGVVRIALRGLTDADLLTLLEGVAGHAMTEDGLALRDAVLAETAGNPFFVGEVLRHLAESGAIYQRDDGRWTAGDDLRRVGLPVSVKEVVGRRIDALGDEVPKVLALAAVIGRDFDVSLLATVAKVEEDDLIDLCDRAVQAAVLQTTDDPDRYTFAHALIEHTLYDGLSPARRARAHRAVAEALEARLGGDADERSGELAHHWAAAVQPSDVVKAVHYAEVAADRALAQLAPDTALGWYQQALELLDRTQGGPVDDDPARRARLMVGVGSAQQQGGLPEHRETLLRAAELADQAGAVDILARAALANTRGFASRIGGVDEERVAVLRRAIERLEGFDDPASIAQLGRLWALLGVEVGILTDLDERVAMAERAVDLARRSGDERALVDALVRSHDSLVAPSTVAQRLALSREACAIADRRGDVKDRWQAHGQRGGTAMEAADHELWRRSAELSNDLARELPLPYLRWNVTLGQVTDALIYGDLVAAEQQLEVAFTLGEELGIPDLLQVCGSQLLNLRHHQGRMGETLAIAEQVLAESPAFGVYRSVVAIAAVGAGEVERGASLLRAEREAGFPLAFDGSWTPAMALWSETAVAVGDVAGGRALRELIEPYASIVFTGRVTIHLTGAHWLGELDHLCGRLDEADAWFAQALEMAEGMRSPMMVAYSQAGWADLLADRATGDDHERARSMASAALSTATEGGYGLVERRARATLDRLG